MFGWVTEKNQMGGIRTNNRSNRLYQFLEELKKNNISLSDCRPEVSSGNCFRLNGKGYMLLFHENGNTWQPYFSTIESMDKCFENSGGWTLVCVNYINGEPLIYMMGSDVLAAIRDDLDTPCDDSRKYYEMHKENFNNEPVVIGTFIEQIMNRGQK